MSDPSPGFFPQRAELDVQEYVLTDFPFPLALTYHRLLAGMNRQEPVEAAWLLRDAFEATMKFVAAVATADLLQARPDPAAIEKVASLLLKPTGLSTGDWHSAMTLPLEASAAHRLLPELKTIFYDSQGDATELNLLLDGSEESFVAWRNRNIGHGVFRQDRAWYAKETLRWLPVLHNLYAALRPVLTPWTLVGETMGQEQVVWHGVRAEELRPREVHEHEAWGEVLPLFLVREGQRLPLGPLLSIQQCRYCYHSIPFFFDKFKKGKVDTTVFGEYLYGQDAAQQDWEGTRTLQTHLPETYRFKATFWEIMAIRRLQDITFRDFEHEYLRPNYLIEAIHRQVRESTKGCLHLIGSEGMGKTFLTRGLGAETPPLGCVYLVYHILPGALTDHQTFISEVKKLAESKLPVGRVEAQLNFDDRKGLQKEFGSYLNGLKTQNKLKRLVLVIDGLDELPDPPAKSAAITDLLPAAGTLPDGVFIVLTSREALRPQIAADLRRLHSGPTNRALFTTRLLRPEDAENQSLLRAYIEKNLPERFCDPDAVETVLRLSGGVFLYAFHLCRAIASRAFPDLESLPLPGQFYPAYLARLRSQVGAAEFESKYLRALLLLCAARIPVSLETLEGWGVPKGALNDILPDIKDFLHIHRSPRWQDTLTDEDDGEPRFEMAHEAFVRYVQEDAVLAPKLTQAHEAILASCLARAKRAGGWDKLDPETEATLYLLRFALLHRDEAGLETTIPVVELHALGQTAFNAGTTALAKARYLLALDLFESQERILRSFLENHPGLATLVKSRNDLATTLVKKGNSFTFLTRFNEAIDCNNEAVHILTELVETRPEFKDNMAIALMGKGVALEDLRRFHEANDCHNEAVRILTELVETRLELRIDLAKALGNQSITLMKLARFEEALDWTEKALLLFNELVEAHPELKNYVALMLSSKGLSFICLDRSEDAIGCCDEAITILTELVMTRPELRADLSRALISKGNALGDLERFHDAIGCYDGAITILTELVEKRFELSHVLAGALEFKGASLRRLARFSEEIDCYDQAITIRRNLNETHPELRDDLADTLLSKGNSLHSLTRFNDAIGCYDGAITILTELVMTRPEHRDNLAIALVSKGDALGDLRRFHDAIGCYDGAITILTELVEARPASTNKLAGALRSKGNSLHYLTRFTEAIDCYDQAITIRRNLVETNPEVRNNLNNLATTLMNKGNSLRSLTHFAEAIGCCDEAITILTELVMTRPELRADLSRALISKGDALGDLERFHDAIGCYDGAITILTELVEARPELRAGLSRALIIKGNSLHSLTRFNDAIGCYDGAVTILTELVMTRPEHRDNLAIALVNKGDSLRSLTRFAEAIGCYDQAITIRQNLGAMNPELDQEVEAKNILAGTLVKKAQALKDLTRFGEAIACCEKAITIRRKIIKTHPELNSDLAGALIIKGISLHNLTRFGEAIACHEEAIAIHRELVKTCPELRSELAIALINKALSLDNLTHFDEAIACCGEAITILRELMKTRPELKQVLAAALINKGISLCNLTRFGEAIASYEEAIAIHRELDKTHPELRNALAIALMNKGNALCNLTRFGEAVACYEEAITIRRELVKTRPELRNDLALALMNKGAGLQDEGRQLSQDGFKAKAFSHFQAALNCYTEGIQVRQEAIQEENALFLLPGFTKALRNRFDLFVRIEIWDRAANDIITAFDAAKPFLGTDSPIPGVAPEFEQLLENINSLALEQRAALDDALGEQNAAVVRQYTDMLE